MLLYSCSEKDNDSIHACFITKFLNDYEQQNAVNINCYLPCLSLNNNIAEVTITGDSQHVLNLANTINRASRF